MLHQIGILHGTETDQARDLFLLGLRELGVLLAHNGEGPLDRLIEKTSQLYVLS